MENSKHGPKYSFTICFSPLNFSFLDDCFSLVLPFSFPLLSRCILRVPPQMLMSELATVGMGMGGLIGQAELSAHHGVLPEPFRLRMGGVTISLEENRCY